MRNIRGESFESIPKWINTKEEEGKVEPKRKKTIDDLKPFTGLDTAYILDMIDKGKTHDEIVLTFAGDEPLVVMWVLFLKHNRWLARMHMDIGR